MEIFIGTIIVILFFVGLHYHNKIKQLTVEVNLFEDYKRQHGSLVKLKNEIEFKQIKFEKESNIQKLKMGNEAEALKSKIENELTIHKRQLENDQRNTKLSIETELDSFDKYHKNAMNELNSIQSGIFELAKQKSYGFPFLAQAYDEYFNIKDLNSENFLRNKVRPALVEAQRLKEVSLERRTAKYENNILKYQIEYYEYLFPWLKDYKCIDLSDNLLQRKTVETDEEENLDKQDPAKLWMSESEYESLSEDEKYQKALIRYWDSKKAPWEIGKLYEQYIGYLYEKKGYKVKYHGILEGFEDMGRDLICENSNEIIIVQCKCWKKENIIHEKHINQLYGTCAKYIIDIKDENDKRSSKRSLIADIKPHFITSAKLSDRAKKFAISLGIYFEENVFLPNKIYPCIKCNISKGNNTKIFHLPFDQQYDKVSIETDRGEFYTSSVSEAINKGFRRAYSWQGNMHGSKT